MTRTVLDSKGLGRGVAVGLLAMGLAAASSFWATGADTKTAPPANPKPIQTAPPKTTKPKLTGAELYALHCNRCHPERYANEWSAAEWKTILTHMRVRANLPAAQAKEILKFLQENSGS